MCMIWNFVIFLSLHRPMSTLLNRSQILCLWWLHKYTCEQQFIIVGERLIRMLFACIRKFSEIFLTAHEPWEEKSSVACMFVRKFIKHSARSRKPSVFSWISGSKQNKSFNWREILKNQVEVWRYFFVKVENLSKSCETGRKKFLQS